MTGLTERLSILIDTVGSGAAARDFDKIGGAAKGLAGQAKAGKFSIDGLASSAGISGAALKTGLAAGAAVAAGALVKFGADSVGAYTGLAASVLGFKRASGASAEQSSLLVAAMDDMGISAETGAKGIFQLGKRLETSAGNLASFGVVAVKGKDGNTDLAATMLSVADAYQSTTDPAKRAALVTAAFGKAGQELIPILEGGRRGIEALYKGARDTGQILSEEDIRKAEDFRLAMDELDDSMKEVKLTVGAAVVPALTDMALGIAVVTQRVSDLAAASKDAGPKVFGQGLAGWAGDALKYGTGLGLIGHTLASIGRASKEPELFWGKFASAADKAIVLTAAATEELADLRSTTLASVGAQRSYDQSLRAVGAAQGGVSAAQGALNTLLAKGAVDTDKVGRATRDLADANKTLERATRDAGDAQVELTGAEKALADLRTGVAAEKAAAAAGDDLTGATIRQGRAVLGLADAEAALAKLRAPQAGTAEEISDADRDVARAQERLTKLRGSGEASALDLADAEDDVGDSLDRLNALRTPTVATAAEITAAELDVTQAGLDLKTANEGVTTATEAVSAAQKVGSENSPEVVAAHATVQTAAEKVAGANDDVVTATQGVIDKGAELTTAQAGDPNFSEEVRKRRADVATAVQGVADAQHNVATQALALTTEQDKLNVSLGASEETARTLKGHFEKLVALSPQLAPLLNPAIATLAQGLAALAAAPRGGGSSGAGGRGGIAVASAAGGGIFTPKEGLVLLHGPEAIIPLGRGATGVGGGGTAGVTVIVQGNVLDGRQLGELVHSALLDKKTRTGSLALA